MKQKMLIIMAMSVSFEFFYVAAFEKKVVAVHEEQPVQLTAEKKKEKKRIQQDQESIKAFIKNKKRKRVRQLRRGEGTATERLQSSVAQLLDQASLSTEKAAETILKELETVINEQKIDQQQLQETKVIVGDVEKMTKQAENSMESAKQLETV